MISTHSAKVSDHSLSNKWNFAFRADAAHLVILPLSAAAEYAEGNRDFASAKSVFI